MADGDEWGELALETKTFIRWAISSLLDSAFLAFWVWVQWLTSGKVIAPLKLSGVDQWVLSAFQILFGVSTLAPVVIYIYADIRVMLLRAQRRIQQEKKLGKASGSTRATQQSRPPRTRVSQALIEDQTDDSSDA